MATNKVSKKVGILGGGQLARMLCLKGFEMGLEMHVLSESPEDPAAQVTGFWHKGSLHCLKTLKSFLNQVHVATYESEFLDPHLLIQAQKRGQINPSPKTMGILQDRLTQKKWLEKYKLPTSPFLNVTSYEELLFSFKWLQSKYKNFQGLVLKKRRFGYDGYGTHMIPSLEALKKLKKLFKDPSTGYLVELLIPFERELALSFCRNKKNQIRVLPLVETYQKDSKCLWVKGPVEHPSMNSFIKKAKNFLEDIQYVGIISFELFETPDGILVNELAPRVHNSAHYSLDALFTDQFSYCLRALLNQPLPPIESISGGFAMYNLIGSSRRTPKIPLTPSLKLHWYGKKENRKGRKMGHLNAVEDTPEQALRLIKKFIGDYQL